MNQTDVKFIMNHALELTVLFDSSGQVVYANQTAEEALSYDQGLTHQQISDIFPNEFGPGCVPVGEQEIPYDFTSRRMVAYRGNRTCFPAEVRLGIYENESGSCIVCLMRDVSHQQYLERRVSTVRDDADMAMRVKSEFVATVTHELRTPVIGILGNIRALLEQEQDERKRKTLQLVETSCNNMQSIINNILDFSKLEAGKFPLELRPFDFRGMINYVKSTHIHKITEKGLDFFVTISPEVPEMIVGDELRVIQILNNLLANATKFTSVGKITMEVLKTAQKGNQIELFFIVIDTGIGIAKEDIGKLFSSFSQVDASISRRYGGTGLGLTIAKQLVELMGGTINCDSEKGRGTMFSFSAWFEVPEGVITSERVDDEAAVTQLLTREDQTRKAVFGTGENRKTLNNQMSKLILSVEMENWEKAEFFMDSIRELTREAPQEIKSLVLRLKMAVQKADYEKTEQAYEKVRESLDDLFAKEEAL